jgi:hypothetical protein
VRSRVRRILASAPTDTWFFLGISAFAAVLLIAYWFWTYDWAGTILLFGFTVASGVNGLRLLLARPPRRGLPSPPRQPAGAGLLEVPPVERGPAPSPSASEGASAAGGEPAPESPDADRPFLDERGRVPAPSIAPLALALAAALVTTSIVFGPWLLVIAILPLTWGAVAWLRDAGAEYRAQEGEDLPATAGGPRIDSAAPGADVATPAGPGRPSASGSSSGSAAVAPSSIPRADPLTSRSDAPGRT